MYVCRKLSAYKSSVTNKSSFMCYIIIAMICADSELYSLFCSAFACKCCHFFSGTLTLSVRRQPLLSYSSPSLSPASSEMPISFYGLLCLYYTFNKSLLVFIDSSLKKTSCSSLDFLRNLKFVFFL